MQLFGHEISVIDMVDNRITKYFKKVARERLFSRLKSYAYPFLYVEIFLFLLTYYSQPNFLLFKLLNMCLLAPFLLVISYRIVFYDIPLLKSYRNLKKYNDQHFKYIYQTVLNEDHYGNVYDKAEFKLTTEEIQYLFDSSLYSHQLTYLKEKIVQSEALEISDLLHINSLLSEEEKHLLLKKEQERKRAKIEDFISQHNLEKSYHMKKLIEEESEEIEQEMNGNNNLRNLL